VHEQERVCAVVVLKAEVAQDPGEGFTMDDMRELRDMPR
jgi:hypothetical protein